MQKNTLNFLVDAVATVAMLLIIATGFLLYLILPPGSRGGHGLEFWGLGRHDWGDIHFWAAVTLLGLMVLHVLLHWDWVCLTVYRWVNPQGFREKRLTPRRQAVYGGVFFVGVLVLVGGFLGLAAAGVTRGEGDHEEEGRGYRGGRGAAAEYRTDEALHAGGEGAGRRSGFGGGGDTDIRGSTTVREAAELAGLSVAELLAELGVPADADIEPGARLSQLRRDYGLEMSEVRQVVAAHAAARRELP